MDGGIRLTDEEPNALLTARELPPMSCRSLHGNSVGHTAGNVSIARCHADAFCSKAVDFRRV